MSWVVPSFSISLHGWAEHAFSRALRLVPVPSLWKFGSRALFGLVWSHNWCLEGMNFKAVSPSPAQDPPALTGRCQGLPWPSPKLKLLQFLKRSSAISEWLVCFPGRNSQEGIPLPSSWPRASFDWELRQPRCLYLVFFKEFSKDPKIFKWRKDSAWKLAGPLEASCLPSLISLTTLELNWATLESSEQQENTGLVIRVRFGVTWSLEGVPAQGGF